MDCKINKELKNIDESTIWVLFGLSKFIDKGFVDKNLRDTTIGGKYNNNKALLLYIF